jgi:F-type H+-transporting ATPase subunit delta
MTEQRVSYRYAKALMGTAINDGLAEVIHNDFQKINEIFNSSRELRSLTASPVFQNWKKKKIYNELFENMKISELSSNFLILLIEKRRGSLIPDIVVQFEKLYNILNNKLEVFITSAIELTEEVKGKIILKLAEKTNMTILPVYKIEPALKGGIMLRIDDWVFDASIKNQLEILFKKLAEGQEI